MQAHPAQLAHGERDLAAGGRADALLEHCARVARCRRRARAHLRCRRSRLGTALRLHPHAGWCRCYAPDSSVTCLPSIWLCKSGRVQYMCSFPLRMSSPAQQWQHRCGIWGYCPSECCSRKGPPAAQAAVLCPVRLPSSASPDAADLQQAHMVSRQTGCLLRVTRDPSHGE